MRFLNIQQFKCISKNTTYVVMAGGGPAPKKKHCICGHKLHSVRARSMTESGVDMGKDSMNS